MSKSEDFIENLLKKENIKFEREKTYDDLKHGQFRFDFCIYVDSGPMLIEFDGEQHFNYIKIFYKNQREWRHMQESDRRKNSYCLANNIPLYRVPYWDLSKLRTVADLFQDKYRVKTRWHNDELKRP